MSWSDIFGFVTPEINISPYGYMYNYPRSIKDRHEYHEWVYQAIKTSEQAKILNRNSKDRYRYNHNTQTYTKVS